MSFTSEIKQELNKNNNLGDKKLLIFELIGYLITNNITFININELRFGTESDYNINRFSKILSNLDIDYRIDVSGKIFSIKCKVLDLKTKTKQYINIKDNSIYVENLLKCNELTEEMYKNIVKGAFLGSGTINNPDKKYHLEIKFSNIENTKNILQLLGKIEIKAKIMQSGNTYLIYIKEGEEISKILALIGANNAVMKFEDVRIQKEMRGKINRIVNCETANLNKTINASVEQISAIKKLKDEGNLYKLDENLKELAELRIKNPNLSLIDLGKKLKSPIGKSGVNYRLKKIMDIANEI